MTDTREPRALIAAAEQAATAGDHVAAERSLREAARLQEASVGPLHPDLANTLNNLGVVCEITGKAEDAEQFYRRAHAIASASLPADHPFVQTSATNLRDFCEARGLRLDRPEPPVAEVPAAPRSIPAGDGESKAPGVIAGAKPAPVTMPPAPVRSAPPVPSTTPPPVASIDPPAAPDLSRPPRATPGRALAVVAVLVVLGLVAYRWLTADAPEDRSPAAATETTPTQPPPAAPAAPASAEPGPVAAPTAPAPPPAAATPANTGSTAAAPPASASPGGRDLPRAPAPPAGGVEPARGAPTIVEAELCRTLSRTGAWRCEPAGSPVAPGPLFFYTRLSAGRDILVRHRWYRGDRLAQAVELRVRANPGSGYRTYSRQTVTAQTAGDWRVELTAEDGTVMHEVRFVVQ